MSAIRGMHQAPMDTREVKNPKLRAARRRRGWSLVTAAVRLNELDASYRTNQNYFLRWEIDGDVPQRHYIVNLCRLLDASPSDLGFPNMDLDLTAANNSIGVHDRAVLAPADPGPQILAPPTTVAHVPISARPPDHDALLSTLSSADAFDLTTWIESSNTSDDAIEYLTLMTSVAAREHTHQPPGSVLSKVLRTHRQIYAVLRGGRQRLRHSRELFRIDAQLLAHICLLLGDLRRDAAALAYGAASVLAAAEGGASPAEAFSAQAQIARWRGRYTDAADLAAAGYASSPSTSIRVLLACQEANAAALAGDSTRARQALERAAAAQVDDGIDSAWTCPPGRYELYQLAVALHTGHPSEALHHAAIARAAWTPGQPAPFGTAAHIRLAGAVAYLELGDLHEASEHIAHVLRLPCQYRLATVTEHMAAVHALLTSPPFRGTLEAAQLGRQVADFIQTPTRGRHEGQ